MSREEDDSQPNLAVGDRVCCVGVKLRSYTGHCSVLSLTFDGPRTALRLPQLNNVTLMRRKTFREIVFPSKPKSKDVALLHRLVPVLRQVFFFFLTITTQGSASSTGRPRYFHSDQMFQNQAEKVLNTDSNRHFIPLSEDE